MTATFFIAKLQFFHCAVVVTKLLGPQQRKSTLLHFGTLKHYLRVHAELPETFHPVSKYPEKASCSNPDWGWLPCWNAAFRCSHSCFEVALHLGKQSVQSHPSAAADMQLQKSAALPPENWSVKRKFTSLLLFRVFSGFHETEMYIFYTFYKYVQMYILYNVHILHFMNNICTILHFTMYIFYKILQFYIFFNLFW